VFLAVPGSSPAQGHGVDTNSLSTLTEPMYQPLVERYVLDQLMQLKHEQLSLKSELAEKVADAKLESSDRALKYTIDTTTIIFYIITAAATILVVLGWRSLKEIRDNIESETSKQIHDLTQEYEKRLNDMETKIKLRSEQIIAAQEEISVTNIVHSLWMRAAIEKSDEERIRIYDKILDLKPNDTEALTYKADALLDFGEAKWALHLANTAVDVDDSYPLAYWQRACAKAELGQTEDAIADLKTAISLSEHLISEISGEKHFRKIVESEEFAEAFGTEVAG
jgi:tetratricopeptide (TPR) repeat protein